MCVCAVGARVIAQGVPIEQPHTFTDQRGKTFTFAQPATRVVTIAIPLLWHFMIVDRSDARIVGANAVASQQLHDGIADRVFPRLASLNTAITRGGTFTPNVEELLTLRPDAVFQWADRGDALMDVLDRAGLRAIGVKNTNSESDIEAWIRMSGVVSGHELRADSIVRWMRRGNARFDSLTKPIPASERPRVLMLTEYSRTLRVDGPGSYSATIIERAGGRNAATASNGVSIEQILAWNPDVIFLSAFEAKRPADFMADPVWRALSASRSGRVYKLPFGVTRWGGYGPESPLFLTWLADLLHPARFALPMRADLRNEYRSLLGFSATDADLDRVLQMDQNGASANYGQFKRSASK
jgi:iron complex transport system substrate-binding protein